MGIAVLSGIVCLQPEIGAVPVICENLGDGIDLPSAPELEGASGGISHTVGCFVRGNGGIRIHSLYLVHQGGDHLQLVLACVLTASCIIRSGQPQQAPGFRGIYEYLRPD
ncbi:hypothetical protein D3C76_1434920 [compost metagenome]